MYLCRLILDKDSQAVKNVEQRGANVIHSDLTRYTFKPEKVHAQWVEEGKIKSYINKIIKLEEVKSTLQQLSQAKAGFRKIVAEISPN